MWDQPSKVFPGAVASFQVYYYDDGTFQELCTGGGGWQYESDDVFAMPEWRKKISTWMGPWGMTEHKVTYALVKGVGPRLGNASPLDV